MKLNPIFPALARHRVEKKEKVNRKLTARQWIILDRIVIAILFAAVIIGAIIFS
jgi:hypothetical protein